MARGILDNLSEEEKEEKVIVEKIEIPKNAFEILTENNLYEIMDWEYSHGKIIKIRVEMLSFEKHRECRIKAKEAIENNGIKEDTFLWDTEFQQELSVYILWNALKDPTEDSNGRFKPAFSTPSSIRKLNPAQIESLLNLYEFTRQKLSISEEALFLTENLETWVEAISTALDGDAKKALARLSFADLVEICAILCKTVHLSMTVTSKQSQSGLLLNQEILNQDTSFFALQQEDGTEKDLTKINKSKIRKTAIKSKICEKNSK
jgi:hypothetical protein